VSLPSPRPGLGELARYHSPQLDVAVRLNTNESPYPPPPAFVDQSSGFVSSAALDSGKSQVTSVTFAKPGTWVFFCPLRDRDGGDQRKDRVELGRNRQLRQLHLGLPPGKRLPQARLGLIR